MDFEKLIRYCNRDSGFDYYCGVVCTAIREGYAELEMPITPDCLNPGRTVHGGLLYSIGDTAAGIAAISHGVACVTLSGSMNYLRPAAGTLLRAVAKEVRHGRTTGVYDIEVFDDAQKLVTKGTYTMYFTGKRLDID